MSESKQRKLGAILSYTSVIVTSLVTLLFTPFLIKRMGQSEYGLYSLVSSVIGYLTVLDLGFGDAIIVYTAKYRAQKKYEEEKKLHGMFKLIYLIIGIIAAIGGIILFLNVDNIFGSTMKSEELFKAKIMMLILSLNLFISFFFSIYSSIVSAYEKFVFQKIVSLSSSILKPLIMIPLLILGFKSISLVIVITILNFSVVFTNYIFCKKKLNIKIQFSKFNKELFKEIFSYSFFIFINVIVQKINYSVDHFVLGAVSGTIAVSLYSVAGQFNSLFRSIASSCGSIALPKISKMIGKNASDEELSNEFIKLGRLQWYIIFAMLTGFIIFGKQFIKVWVGNDYNISYYIALILIIPESLVLVQNIGVYIMQVKKKHKFKAIVAGITAIVNLAISIPLAKAYGGIGSAIGTALALIICNLIIINIYYYKTVKLNVLKFWKNIIKISIPNLILFISAYVLVNRCIIVSGLKNIIIFGSIYVTIYSILSFFISFNEYEKNIIKKILKKVFKNEKKQKNNN